MIDYILSVTNPAKIKQLEAKLKASRKATKKALWHLDCLHGEKVTLQDIKDVYADVQRMEQGGSNEMD